MPHDSDDKEDHEAEDLCVGVDEHGLARDVAHRPVRLEEVDGPETRAQDEGQEQAAAKAEARIWDVLPQGEGRRRRGEVWCGNAHLVTRTGTRSRPIGESGIWPWAAAQKLRARGEV